MKYPDNRKLLSTPTGAITFRFCFFSLKLKTEKQKLEMTLEI